MNLILPESDELKIEYFGHLFDNTSECYKMFWFQVIIEKILAGRTSATYEEIIDEMITDAWYMVAEYHLNLGPRDNLEFAVDRLVEISGFKPSEDKAVLLEYIRNCQDPEVLRYKRTLTENVPYRLQAPFLDFSTADWKGGKKLLIERINAYCRLIYKFDLLDGLNTRIHFDEKWSEYIVRNQIIIKGWLKYNLVEYLQRRNPNVPGVIDKLYPPQERKLVDIQKYWKMIMTVQPVVEIYGNGALTETDISIDHFVPWSYVANDEIWNLHPTTKSINSAKSNHLPKWDVYFKKLSDLEYLSYQLMWKHEGIHREFDKVKRKHLNSQTVEGRLYAPNLSRGEFESRLSEIVLPVYQSAKSAGFREWEYTG
ncbi:MAG: HNH endonuclease [Eubacterium sp.]|uniref:HNH nuclease domain-containing protein n=1 Tax=Eubacterium cellulosolvens (strain ATCC 43171 / JCM 9499 / 6) TaxID=633697 RepID=I5AWY4_EUBC6|nr:HNH endonuclease [Eubacterium sp.]